VLEGPGPLQLPGGGRFNDDDLEPAILKVDDMAASAWASGAAGGAQGLLNGVKLQISHTANLALWRTQNKEPLAVTYTFTSNGAPSNVPDEIWVEGRELGTGSVTWELVAPTEANPGGEVVASDVVNFTVTNPIIDLDAKAIYHNAPVGDLSDDLEDYPGAYVPVNNDDDDYDLYNDEDRSQSGAIAGESDLLPIVLHQIEPSILGGTYRLHIPGNVRVWYNADRTGAVSDLSTFPAVAEDETLYVEGYQPGGGILYIDWWNETCEINAADTVAVTVFDWEGPLNVPDHSIHRYTATGGASGPGSSTWLEPVNGSITWSSQADPGPDEVKIKWNGGPAVGKAVYQAAPDYIWDLEVNVVQVEIAPPDEGSTFRGHKVYDMLSRVERGVELKTISAGSHVLGIPGLEWWAKVSLNGPIGDRGVKFMRIGFVQSAAATSYSGSYHTVSASLHSNVQAGGTYLDASSEFDRPYQSRLEPAVFFDPDPTAQPPRKVKTIGSNDGPQGGPPLTFDKGIGVRPGDDVLDFMQLCWDFDLYVTARTVDARNNADLVYTSRATAHWQFDATGSIGQVPLYFWTPASSAGVYPPGAWIPVTDGSQPPVMTGDLFNDAIQNDEWN